MNQEPIFNVNYYNAAAGIIKPIDLLACLPFELGTACKYLLRYPYKGYAKQDLKKAIDYLEMVLADLQMASPHPKYETAAVVWHLLRCFNGALEELYQTHLQPAALSQYIEVLTNKLNTYEE